MTQLFLDRRRIFFLDWHITTFIRQWILLRNHSLLLTSILISHQLRTFFRFPLHLWMCTVMCLSTRRILCGKKLLALMLRLIILITITSLVKSFSYFIQIAGISKNNLYAKACQKERFYKLSSEIIGIQMKIQYLQTVIYKYIELICIILKPSKLSFSVCLQFRRLLSSIQAYQY